ncbi:hypothetical protein V6Z11_D13G004500 [Gossypium hirsutum]
MVTSAAHFNSIIHKVHMGKRPHFLLLLNDNLKPMGN